MHGQHIRRMAYGDALHADIILCRAGVDLLLVAHSDDFHAQLLNGEGCTLQYGLGGVVAAERINNDLHNYVSISVGLPVRMTHTDSR